MFIGKVELFLNPSIAMKTTMILQPAPKNMKPLTARHLGLSNYGRRLATKQALHITAASPIQTHFYTQEG